MGFGSAGRAGRAGPRAGGDIAMTAEITLEQAAFGEELELTFEAIETCERCHGNGAEPGTPISTCERCGGAGVLQAVTRSPFGQVMRTVTCDVCGGDGKVAQTPCERCDGRGREVRRRALQVDVPAGIEDGQRIRLTGRGHAGERGGPPGDLYVLVRVRPDERFVRDGDDLVTVLDVPAPLAALGATLDAPSLLDGSVAVEIEAGTQPGEVVTVRGQGMPVLRRGGGARGDLRVVVNVVIPRRLDGEQRAIVQQLADAIRPENLRTDDSLLGKLKRLLG
jgi:molecular chaperone DnaJ